MRLLLDTQVFLWWIVDEESLSDHARNLMRDGSNILFLSAASAWEIAIKASIGRLDIGGEPAKVIAEQMAANAIQPLPIQVTHALHTYDLPRHHRDPFDRLLIAQCQVEGLPILTSDHLFLRYEVDTVW
ncbi:MAG: type II toxin-antitoxin system VapC family toxin [Chloroflexota bacterium]